MAKIIFFALATITQQYVINYINESFVKPRISKHIIVWIYVIANCIQVTIAQVMPGALFFKMLFGWFFLIGILFFFYEGSYKRKIMAFIETLAITFGSDIITTQLYFRICKHPLDIAMTYTIDRSIMGFLCSIIQIPFVYIINRIQKKFKLNLNLNGKQWKYLAIIILSQIMSLSIYDFGFYAMNEYMNEMVIIAGICLLTFDIWICRVIVLLEVKKETEESIVNMAEWNKMMTEYYSDVSDKINKLSDLSDIYENKLKNIYALAGKEYEGQTELNEYEFVECDNTVVNKIIKKVCLDLQKMNCKYDIQMNIPNEIEIEIMDLSSVFINLFDNAMCAIKKYMDEKGINDEKINQNLKYHLRVVADYVDGELVVEVKNIKSRSDKVRRINDMFITTKENKDAHGYGIQIIKRVAEKYNGAMTIEYDDNSFDNKVILKV